MGVKKDKDQIINEAIGVENEYEFDKGESNNLEDVSFNIYKQLQEKYDDEYIGNIVEKVKEIMEKKDINEEIYEESEADNFYDDELM